MNSTPCRAKKIDSKPYQIKTEFPELDGKWFVTALYDSCGLEFVHSEMFDTLEEAEKLKVGDILHK